MKTKILVVGWAAAEEHFAALQQAFVTMPVAALLDDPLAAGNPKGQPAANSPVVDGPQIAEDAEHFRTKSADRSGQHVWTDIHRIGKVTVVVQAIATEKAAADVWRDATIEAIAGLISGS